MTIDSMRVGGGRCPPLLVTGLLIACIMMVCNWWTLSSTNLELLRQIDELNEQIKISVEERDQCVTLREGTEKQLKASQDDCRTTHVKLSQIDDMLTTCNTELKSLQQHEVTKTATLETMRMAQQTTNARLNAKIEENKELEEELKKVKKELEQTKLSVNEPKPKLVPVLPIAKILEKTDNKTTNIGGNQGDPAVNKTVNSGNQVPNPQMNAPPNAANIDAQEGQDKDNSNTRDDNNAAEVHEGNGVEPEFQLNLISDAKNNDDQNK